MATSISFIIFGLILLCLGGELLVRGSSKLALFFGMSPLVVGLTIVAYGTSAPELGVSVLAAMSGKAELVVANVVGSNIFNTCFILGLCGLISPLYLNSQLMKFDLPVMVVISLITWGLIYSGNISQLEGFLLFVIAVAYTAWLIRLAKKEKSEIKQEFELKNKDKKNKRMKDVLFFIFLIISGLVILVLGARFLVDGATVLAKSMGVSDTVIGLTIVAIGTSLPEVATSVMATIRGHRDIAIGNIVGSNIFNLSLILGVSASASSTGIEVDPAILKYDFPIMTAIIIFAYLMFLIRKKLSRCEGAALFLGFIGYNIFLLFNAIQ